jgi:hypothetical protein
MGTGGCITWRGEAPGAWSWPLLSSSEVKKGGAIPPLPHTSFLIMLN